MKGEVRRAFCHLTLFFFLSLHSHQRSNRPKSNNQNQLKSQFSLFQFLNNNNNNDVNMGEQISNSDCQPIIVLVLAIFSIWGYVT